ncbi:MAG: DUF350 domain-containing protein [Thermodesulfobacteriota bacterium]|nr:DUF350 domain-containing protein [Thermodesulfobacteriota bacterium]
MESQVLFATFFNLGINLIYTILALILGVVALIIIDKQLLKTIVLEEELKKGNIAIAVFSSTILLFIAIIVSFGLKG